jgi:hypothetical protein
MILGKSGKINQIKMKKIINYLFSDKVYIIVVALTGAYFVHKGNYPIAYMELVVLVMLLLKPKKDEHKDRNDD